MTFFFRLTSFILQNVPTRIATHEPSKHAVLASSTIKKIFKKKKSESGSPSNGGSQCAALSLFPNPITAYTIDSPQWYYDPFAQRKSDQV